MQINFANTISDSTHPSPVHITFQTTRALYPLVANVVELTAHESGNLLYTDASQIDEKLEMGCYVSRLYLEGASWDLAKSCLAAQHPKKLIEKLPILQVIPIEANRLKLQNTFRTPVYVTQSRRNAMGVGLVFEADLFSHEHASHWVLQGVALCLNTDA